MTWILERRGRPRYVADLDFSHDSEFKLWDKFYAACEDLRYREIMGLSRALGCNERTIESWKYRERAPRYGTMAQVIAWVEAGKPMKLEQRGAKPGML